MRLCGALLQAGVLHALHVEAVGGGNFSVPEPGVLDGSRLVAEVHIGEPISLTETVRPFEVIEQRPGMIGADIGSILYRPCKLLQIASEELDPADPIGYICCLDVIASGNLEQIRPETRVSPRIRCSSTTRSLMRDFAVKALSF